MYTLAMAKNDFQENWISSFTLIKKGNDWMIEISQEAAEPTIKRCISTARGEIRMFKTIDNAVKTAEQIGFPVHALKLEVI